MTVKKAKTVFTDKNLKLKIKSTKNHYQLLHELWLLVYLVHYGTFVLWSSYILTTLS